MNADPPKMETDPNLAAEQAAAAASLTHNLQNEAQFDTANLMSRYGTRLALGTTGAVPTASTPNMFGKL